MSEHYVGSELEVFAQANNWKAYVGRLLHPWLGPRVLEVGAGIGNNVATLFVEPVSEFVALEPDPNLARQITGASSIIVGTIEAVDQTERFDTILYLDVIEHIADDAAELTRAARLLAPQGRLVVLVPAHQFLFTPFDAAIGHYRRYDRAALRAIGPEWCRLERLLTLDAVGFLASMANRWILRSSMPTPDQIRIWDRGMVPLSVVLDRWLGFRMGKSMLAVWTDTSVGTNRRQGGAGT